MKKRLGLWAVLLLAIVVALVGSGGPMGLPLSIRIGERIGITETTFAQGYDERIFDDIQVGMTSNTVTMKLGRPLWARELDKQNISATARRYEWSYTFVGPSSTHYYERFIYFDDEHKVVEKIKGIYLD